ncbi:hypothetical protein LUZ63_017941 [Rhynchospora breviuscula]|uniref:Uncharacterized protein n=1 Tax=Rhynchospora breviuscula TaxID=2022672 RepID=A0A9Q0C3F0_9POAL|nr:hypothetical protein LUZ63_017941 [Rhynchospora breviuscula]
MEIIHYGEKKRHLFNQEENQPDSRCFLTCRLLLPCLSPSISPHKKQKHSFLLAVHAKKISSLFLNTDKKHHHSRSELVTGTLFGQKTMQGHLHLVIQTDPKSSPLVVLELASSTNFFMKTIVKEPLQLFLTCVKKDTSMSIWEEWKWTEHANGRVVGGASRIISEAANLEFLEVIEHVTCGTGVIPDYEDRVKGELMYMRAQFKKMKWSFDSESLAMVRSENTGCTDINICFSRV